MKAASLEIALATALLSACACASGPVLALHRLERPSCAAGSGIEWVGPTEPAQRLRLAAWCESAGPAVIASPDDPDPPVDLAQTGLAVVSWNIHEGGGDVERLLARLRRVSSASPAAGPAIVLLVQEAMRGGPLVPSTVPAAVSPPGRIAPPRARLADIVDAARQLGLWIAYVPSMRNGRGAAAADREDRGSAILSTLPLSEAVAIELPWVHQRRVAVMATVSARVGSAPWRARMVSVHLDNRPSRSRQAAALADFLRPYAADAVPLVLGGDLNTWLGAREATVSLLDAVVPRVKECGGRATFRFGLHLDHILTTFPPGVRRGCEILADAFGSDHRPTVLRLLGSSWR
ncbi:MAG: endonuclease/exonuclease/phosphatase family protein [Acidobacteriota bacterium]